MDDGYTAAADLSPLEAVHSVKSLDRESKRQKEEKSKRFAKKKKDSVKISSMSSDQNNEIFSDDIVVKELKDEKYPDKKGRRVDIVIG